MLRTLKRIIIIGFNPYSACFAERAASAGVDIFFIGLTLGNKPFGHAPGLFQKKYASLDLVSLGTDKGMEAVKAIVEKLEADAILSADDWILFRLGKTRALFEPRCLVLAPDPAMLEQMWDKHYQAKLAASSGFAVLPSFSLLSANDAFKIPANPFPVVIRPSYTNSVQPSFKVAKLSNPEELAAFYRARQWTHPPIIQSFRLAPSYILHGVRSLGGEILALRFFKAYRKYHGYCSSMKPVDLPKNLEASARQFIEQGKVTGPFHFDFLAGEEDNKAYFLEINIRMGGSSGKALLLGYDEPRLMLEAVDSQPPKPFPPLHAYLKATSLGLNLRQLTNEVLNRRDPFAYPQLPRLQSIKAILKELLSVRKG